MANITEVSQWESVIRQIENGEAATGGADGLANVQAKQLANRTKWLKENYLPLIGGALAGNSLTWNGNDLAGSAIVAKSIREIGYIKYASGLIIQWGNVGNPNQTTGMEVKFPITFNNNVICTITPKEANYTAANRGKSFLMCSVTLSSFKIEMPEAVTYFNYIAIGW